MKPKWPCVKDGLGYPMHKYRGGLTCLRCGHVKGTGGRGANGSIAASQATDAGSRPVTRAMTNDTFEERLDKWQKKMTRLRWTLPGGE